MPETYKTISGDTWDMIAWKVYEDCSRVGLLMQANPEALDYFVFPGDVVLTVPVIEEVGDEEAALPEWRM